MADRKRVDFISFKFRMTYLLIIINMCIMSNAIELNVFTNYYNSSPTNI